MGMDNFNDINSNRRRRLAHQQTPFPYSYHPQHTHPQDWELRDRFDGRQQPEHDVLQHNLLQHYYVEELDDEEDEYGDRHGNVLESAHHNRRATYGGLGNDQFYTSSNQRKHFSSQQSSLQNYPIPPLLTAQEEALVQSAYERIAYARSQGRDNVDLTPDEIAAIEQQRIGLLPRPLSNHNQRVEFAKTAPLASPPATPKAIKSGKGTESAKTKSKTGSRSSSAASLAAQQSTVKAKKKSTFLGGYSSPSKSKSRSTSRKNSLQLEAPPMPSPPAPGTRGVPLAQLHGVGLNISPGPSARYSRPTSSSRSRSNSRLAGLPGQRMHSTQRFASSPETSRPGDAHTRERIRSRDRLLRDRRREQDYFDPALAHDGRYDYNHARDYGLDRTEYQDYPTLPSARYVDFDESEYYAPAAVAGEASTPGTPTDARRFPQTSQFPPRTSSRELPPGSPGIRYSNIRRVPVPVSAPSSPLVSRDATMIPPRSALRAREETYPGLDRTPSNESYDSTTQESSEDSEGGRGVHVEVGMDGNVTRGDVQTVSAGMATRKKGKDAVVATGSSAKKRKSSGRR